MHNPDLIPEEDELADYKDLDHSEKKQSQEPHADGASPEQKEA